MFQPSHQACTQNASVLHRETRLRNNDRRAPFQRRVEARAAAFQVPCRDGNPKLARSLTPSLSSSRATTNPLSVCRVFTGGGDVDRQRWADRCTTKSAKPSLRRGFLSREPVTLLGTVRVHSPARTVAHSRFSLLTTPTCAHDDELLAQVWGHGRGAMGSKTQHPRHHAAQETQPQRTTGVASLCHRTALLTTRSTGAGCLCFPNVSIVCEAVHGDRGPPMSISTAALMELLSS